MKYYIFLASDGITKTPKDKCIDNLQVLGISRGDSKAAAFDNFINENSFLNNSGFNEIISMELKNDKQSFFEFDKK